MKWWKENLRWLEKTSIWQNREKKWRNERNENLNKKKLKARKIATQQFREAKIDKQTLVKLISETEIMEIDPMEIIDNINEATRERNKKFGGKKIISQDIRWTIVERIETIPLQKEERFPVSKLIKLKREDEIPLLWRDIKVLEKDGLEELIENNWGWLKKNAKLDLGFLLYSYGNKLTKITDKVRWSSFTGKETSKHLLEIERLALMWKKIQRTTNLKPTPNEIKLCKNLTKGLQTMLLKGLEWKNLKKEDNFNFEN